MPDHKLIVVRNTGLVTETEFSGWNSEGISDRLFNEAKEDLRTVFACTIVGNTGEGGGRQWYANEERMK
jgi:hypothetical protein